MIRHDLLRDLTLDDDEVVFVLRLMPHAGPDGGAMATCTVYNAGEEQGVEVGPWERLEAVTALLSPQGFTRLLAMLPPVRQDRLFPLGSE